MSFSDLESGNGPKISLTISDDATKLTSKISRDIVRINGNITTIQKLIDQLGTKKDTPTLRSRLHNLTENTRELVKNVGLDVKAFPNTDTYAQQKLSTDFTRVFNDFQRIQRVSAEKQREYVIKAKQARETLIDIEGDGSEDAQLIDIPTASNPQLQLVDNQQVEYNDLLIEEREVEIREIESSIHELSEIFRDLGAMVTEQGEMLDNIESNVTNVSMHVRNAADELTTASRYQRQARRRMCCLLLIIAVIAAIVILAVLA